MHLITDTRTDLQITELRRSYIFLASLDQGTFYERELLVLEVEYQKRLDNLKDNSKLNAN